MADKATKKAIIYLLLASVGLILCILYADALRNCPHDLRLPYAALTMLCTLQVISGVILAILTRLRKEQSRFGKIITVIFTVCSIPITLLAVLWALLILFKSQ